MGHIVQFRVMKTKSDKLNITLREIMTILKGTSRQRNLLYWHLIDTFKHILVNLQPRCSDKIGILPYIFMIFL